MIVKEYHRKWAKDASILQRHKGSANCLGGGFLSGSAVKNLPAMQEPQETWVRSLGQEEHPPEEGMATGFSTPAWRTPRTEESGELQSKGLQRAGPD